MTIKSSIPDKGVRALIEQAYESGSKYQWARETLVNSLQAHATWVEFGVEPQMLEATGVAKRYVADNGVGMDEDELKTYMKSFSESGKGPVSSSSSGNYGQGQKSSCYPWNTYGMIVASWTPNTPDGCAVWIHLDSEGFYGMREFDIEDEDGEIYDRTGVFIPQWDEELGIDLSKLKTSRISAAGHGTVFLFLGDSLDRSTEHGDFLRGENTLHGIIKYLNSRFVDIPNGVEVKVAALEARNEDSERPFSKDSMIEIAGGPNKNRHSRTVNGIIESSVKKSNESGVVKVDNHGTLIQWILSPESDGTADLVRGQGSYGLGKPCILVEYKTTYAEAEHAPVTINEAYNTKNNIQTYRKFGATRPEVANRLWLMIKPPAYMEGSTRWGVVTNASRSGNGLKAKGEEDLPIDSWADEFERQLPIPIKNALDKARAEESTTQGDDTPTGRVRMVMDKFAPRMNPPLLNASSKGRILGDLIGHTAESKGNTNSPDSDKGSGGNNTVNNTGSRAVLQPKKRGTKKGVQKKSGNNVPGIRWIMADDWQDGEGMAAVWDPKDTKKLDDGSLSDGVILFNLGFPLFNSEFKYWSEECWPKWPSKDVEKVVRGAYALELTTKVGHVRLLKTQLKSVGGTAKFSSDDETKLLSPMALTLGVLGLQSVEPRIRTLGGQAFGKAEDS